MSLADPGKIMGWLEKIDSDLANLRNGITSAAARYFHKKRDFELAWAKAYVDAEGTNQKARESAALIHVESLPVYSEFVSAEADYHAFKLQIDVLQTRATICQSLLKIDTRQANYG